MLKLSYPREGEMPSERRRRTLWLLIAEIEQKFCLSTVLTGVHGSTH